MRQVRCTSPRKQKGYNAVVHTLRPNFVLSQSFLLLPKLRLPRHLWHPNLSLRTVELSPWLERLRVIKRPQCNLAKEILRLLLQVVSIHHRVPPIYDIHPPHMYISYSHTRCRTPCTKTTPTRCPPCEPAPSRPSSADS